MSNARTDLLIFITVAFMTAIGLFVVQQVCASYIDMSYHADLNQRPGNDAKVARQKADAEKLAAGKLSIDRAKAVLAEKGRNGIGSIAPVRSDDLSPISGWIRARDFKPAVAHPIRTPRAPIAEPPPVMAAPVEPAPSAQ
jgi:hypothetical protein